MHCFSYNFVADSREKATPIGFPRTICLLDGGLVGDESFGQATCLIPDWNDSSHMRVSWKDEGSSREIGIPVMPLDFDPTNDVRELILLPTLPRKYTFFCTASGLATIYQAF
ncbi:hypothetical protein [Cyclobacterium xiamenense]|uniref:hypothetical protein n=1 Tax=Cyclobacterium xiamenense TaxID=1297121 RepID=UPI0035CF64FF